MASPKLISILSATPKRGEPGTEGGLLISYASLCPDEVPSLVGDERLERRVDLASLVPYPPMAVIVGDPRDLESPSRGAFSFHEPESSLSPALTMVCIDLKRLVLDGKPPWKGEEGAGAVEDLRGRKG